MWLQQKTFAPYFLDDEDLMVVEVVIDGGREREAMKALYNDSVRDDDTLSEKKEKVRQLRATFPGRLTKIKQQAYWLMQSVLFHHARRFHPEDYGSLEDAFKVIKQYNDQLRLFHASFIDNAVNGFNSREEIKHMQQRRRQRRMEKG